MEVEVSFNTCFKHLSYDRNYVSSLVCGGPCYQEFIFYSVILSNNLEIGLSSNTQSIKINSQSLWSIILGKKQEIENM